MAERTAVVDGGSGNRIALQSGDTVAGLVRPLFQRIDTVTTSGTTEQDLYSNSIAANTFISDKGTMVFEYSGVTDATNVSSNLIVQFATSTLLTTDDFAPITGDSISWKINGTIIRESSSVFRANVSLICAGVTAPVVTSRVTGLNLVSNAYNLQLRALTDAAGDISANFGYAMYLPGV